MSKYCICCEKCFECIGKRSTNAARLWMDLCTTKMDCGNPVVCMPYETPEIRALELLGYVVSTEMQDHVRVNVLGYFSNEYQHAFCIKGGNHGS